MADAAARREARRQRILNNPEGRMNRLIGKSPHVSATPSDGLSSNNSAADVAADQVPASARVMSGAMGEPDPDTLHTGLRARADRRPLGISREQNAPAFPPVQEGTSHQKVDAALDQRLTDNGEPSPRSTPSSSSSGLMPHATEETLRNISMARFLTIISLACIVRWMFYMNLQFLFWGSIFVPFFLFEALLYYCEKKFFKEAQGPQQQRSLMAAALVLAGLQPEVIATYNYVISIFSKLLEDFCIFSFHSIVLHTLLAVD